MAPRPRAAWVPDSWSTTVLAVEALSCGALLASLAPRRVDRRVRAALASVALVARLALAASGAPLGRRALRRCRAILLRSSGSDRRRRDDTRTCAILRALKDDGSPGTSYCSCHRKPRAVAADAKRVIPVRTYTDAHGTRFEESIALAPIGHVACAAYRERFGTPRQPNVAAEGTVGAEFQVGVIVLRAGMEETLRDLAGFDYVWVIAHMHLNTGWSRLVTPPRGPPKRKRGVFATRSPHRPTQVALSALRVEAVDEENLRIRVRGLDLLDGTPVLDIKPYIPYCDAFPDAKAGWIDDLQQVDHTTAADRLPYSPPPPHLIQTPPLI